MDRKAQGYEMLIWVPRFVYLIIVIMATSGLILAFIVTNVDVGDVESHILMHRLQFSRDSVTKYDSETERVYPGLVDESRLKNNLASAMAAGEKDLAARFVLSDLSSGSIVPVYVNWETYLNWQPIAAVVGEDEKISGTGKKTPHTESRYVYSGAPKILETVVITPYD